MTHMMLRRRDHGATGIEYGLIAALVAAVLISIVSITGVNLSTVYCSVAGKVGTATGVDGPCNDIGGGIDDPDDPGDYVCVDGLYAGDYNDSRFYWVKSDQYENGVYDYLQGIPQYRSYGPDSDENAKGSFVKTYWTIYPLDSWGGEQMAPPNDNFERVFYPADPCSGDFKDPNDPGDGGNTDPYCVIEGEGWTYIGPHENWYWTKTEYFENGKLVTGASDPVWSGNDKYAYYSWDERGALLTDRDSFGPANWRKLYGVPTYYANIYYEHGMMTVYADEGAEHFNGEPEKFAPGFPDDRNSWTPDLKSNEPYAENEKGDLQSVFWWASPSDDGGAQYETGPATGDDDVSFDYDCSGGSVGPG